MNMRPTDRPVLCVDSLELRRSQTFKRRTKRWQNRSRGHFGLT